MKQEKIYAKDTIAQEISIEIATDFINQNCKQKMPSEFTNAQSYGLYDKNINQLIAVIVFATPQTKIKREKYKWELLRLCFKKNIIIPDGTLKLIQYFIKDVEPVNFFTYQDTIKDHFKSYELFETILKNKSHTFNKHYDNQNENISENNIYYDWHNDNYVYYTYKITATDSQKYYYGRKTYHKKNNNYSENDLLNDNYYGSGGVKFNNWKKKHKDNIEKEIIQVYSHWGESVKGEKDLIGQLYKNDKNCLNSVAGGTGQFGGAHKREYKEKHCPVHGLTLHSRNFCCKCSNNKNITMKHCSTHGLTKFNGDNCCKCTYNKSYFQKECSVHGLTTFTKNGCCKCTNSNAVSFLSHCDKHGDTYHYKNGQCMSCSHEKVKNITIKHCPKHGDTQHKGDTCLKCSLDKVYDTTTCIIHGDSKHKNGYCLPGFLLFIPAL